MTKQTPAKSAPKYEANAYYDVALSRAVDLPGGAKGRPQNSYRMKGAVVEQLGDAVLTAVKV